LPHHGEAHIAHDCHVGNNAIIVNGVLGGHVTVGNYAIVGGLSAVHQFYKYCDHMISGGSLLRKSHLY
jgi:UDP-N-acetylglucosamine acyltransferase